MHRYLCSCGSIRLGGHLISGEYEVRWQPMRSPCPSVNRGVRISMHTDEEIQCTLVDDRMTRSILFETPSAAEAVHILQLIENDESGIATAAASTGRFVKLIDIHSQIAGNLLF